jgi:ligand-binding sensor domain-containing protein
MYKKLIFIVLPALCLILVILMQGNRKHTPKKCAKNIGIKKLAHNAEYSPYKASGFMLASNMQVMDAYQDSDSSISASTTRMIRKNGTIQWLYIRCAIEDKAGNLWFGTTGEGVYRYTPSTGEYTNFTMREGLVNNQVACLLEDKTGNIWIGTAGGACRYDGKTFTSLSIPGTRDDKSNPFSGPAELKIALNQVQPRSVINMIQDRRGNLWFGTDYGVYRYDGKRIANYLFHECGPDKQSRPANIINRIFEDQEGNIWFSSRTCGTLYRLDETRGGHSCINQNCPHNLLMPQGVAAHEKEITKSFVRMTTKEGHDITAYSILQDKKGGIWLGTYDSGVYHYDGKSLARFSKESDLARSYVSNIIEDKAGNIWFATYGRSVNHFQGSGVYRYDGRSLSHYAKEEGLCSNNVVRMLEDQTGKIWFGSDGEGISYYDPATNGFVNFMGKEGVVNDYVTCVIMDKTGNLWFGTMDLGLYRYDGKSFADLARKGC